MRAKPALYLCFLLAIVSTAAGCADTIAPAPQYVANEPPPPMAPAVDLPVDLRPHNWTAADGSGSCVNASTVYILRVCNLPALANWWRRNHSGGETDASIRRHYDAAGLEYVYTLNAEASFLDWASETRRGAIIWFYPRHCVTFCGFHRDPDGVHAYINDNNRPAQFIRIPRDEFLARWKNYGGFALSLLDEPIPPPLFPAYRKI